MKINKKGALQVSFGWLFAIIVGIFILFLAIFAVTKLINVGNEFQTTKTGKEIGVLLNPLETGFETGKTSFLTMPVETRIYNDCTTNGNFGKQLIKISQKSFNKWVDTDLQVGFSNKYIFSGEFEEGKKFFIFSKPLELPYKVTDLIYLVSSDKKYCFYGNVPEDIEDEISSLNQENLLLNNCTNIPKVIGVCFQGNCDIKVNYANGKGNVIKNGEDMYFNTDSLMYAAIFSDKELYECQLKRTMKRAGSLANIYKDKASFISRINCNSNLNSNLLALSSIANSLNSSRSLVAMNSLIDDLNDKNDLADCRLW